MLVEDHGHRRTQGLKHFFVIVYYTDLAKPKSGIVQSLIKLAQDKQGFLFEFFSKIENWSNQKNSSQSVVNTYQREPTLWSCDTGQQIHVPCFNSCQLAIAVVPNIKERCYKQRSLSTY